MTWPTKEYEHLRQPILALRAEWKTWAEVGEALNLSRDQARWAAQRLGISTKSIPDMRGAIMERLWGDEDYRAKTLGNRVVRRWRCPVEHRSYYRKLRESGFGCQAARNAVDALGSPAPIAAASAQGATA